MSLRSIHDQRGGVLLTIVGMVPLFFFLAGLGVDLSGWNALRNLVQSEADAAANQLANSFAFEQPMAELRRSIVADAAKQGIVATVTTDDSAQRVTVSMEAHYAARFAGMLGAGSRAFAVRRQATARIIPTDRIIVLADGSSLRPGIERNARRQFARLNSGWGDIASWPAAGLFRCSQRPADSTQAALQNDWLAYGRWATQGCFNPAFSALKHASILLLEPSESPTATRIGVIATPGSVSSQRVETVAPIVPSNAGAGCADVSNGRACFTKYYDPETGTGDELCAMLGQSQASAFDGGIYRLPRVESATLDESLGWASPCGRPFRSQGIIPQGFLNSRLTVSQAVFFRAAKLPAAGVEQAPRVLNALGRAMEDLRAASFVRPPGELRTGIDDLTRREIVVLSDTLFDPHSERGAWSNTSEFDFSAFLQQAKAQNIRVKFYILDHQFLSSDRRANLSAQSAAISDMISTSSIPELSSIVVLQDPQAFVSRVDSDLRASKRIVLER